MNMNSSDCSSHTALVSTRCEMESVLKSSLSGATDSSSKDRVIQVKVDSTHPEIMQIGHTKQSATFVPGIKASWNLVFIDCPGFNDNRGAEINIANAVNIKLALHGTESVRIVIIINYHSIKVMRMGDIAIVWYP